ncbi:MAG: sulfite exporter TauE/SafE family protein [Beijerinckiaceae bacterium]
MPITDPLFYALAAPAVFLMAMGKGGFGGNLAVLAMPLMAMSAPALQAAAIMMPILIIMDAISCWAWRNSWSRENIVIMLPAGIAGTFVGYLTASMVSDAALRLMIGLLSLGFCLQVWLARTRDEPPRQPDWARGSFWSGISGFTSFISHVGGPQLSVYLLPQKLPKEILAGTFTIHFTIINLVKLPGFAALGVFTPQNLWTSAALLPVAVVGTFFGVWLVKRVSTAFFYRIMYVILFLVALKLVWDGVRGLAG